MLTLSHIKEIISQCREIGNSGLNNGINALIPELEIDVLQPPRDFLGIKGNPAIFINKDTYKLLGKKHKTWIVDKTIALKNSFLELAAIQIIGVIVHETGHAFNIAAGIENSEANAYIFEIEVMIRLHKTGSLKLLGCGDSDLHGFFCSRMRYYKMDTAKNPYLEQLVVDIEQEYELSKTKPAVLKEANEGAIPPRFKPHGFFDSRRWIKEEQIVMRQLNALASR